MALYRTDEVTNVNGKLLISEAVALDPAAKTDDLEK